MDRNNNMCLPYARSGSGFECSTGHLRKIHTPVREGRACITGVGGRGETHEIRRNAAEGGQIS